MSKTRQEQITERLAQIPRAYRKTYDRAVKGKSLRSAVNAQCQECCYYQIDEIRNCTDLACQLWAVRPYQESSQNSHDERFSGAESKNFAKRYQKP